MTKTCSRCRLEKQLDDFHRGSASHGRNSYCRSCHREWQQEHRREPLPFTPWTERECTRCKETKPMADFHKSTHYSARGRGYWCKACQADYYRAKVQENPDYFLRFQREARARKRAKCNAIKTSAGCVDCGEAHVACLEFHHTDPDQKEDCVMKLVDANATWARIEAEIAKCEVLCSNCHRKRHYNEKQAAKQSVA